jgi:cleavage and polyadenylation specificity factor subunit 3
MNNPPEIQAMDGRMIPLRMSVDYISFSAHVDFTQNSQFIAEVNAPHVVLVHGEANAMLRLKVALQQKFADSEENTKVYTPRNCETLSLHFRGEKMAKVRKPLSICHSGIVRMSNNLDFLDHW